MAMILLLIMIHILMDPFDDRRCKTGVNREPDDYLRIIFLYCLSIKVYQKSDEFLLADNARYNTAKGAYYE